ncbi:MAG: T9SS type A sorting domain-containing protein [Bacteroidales bacterium]|nr:T9SS type A sorting domain-containing protein [Bacteroidales bacterium]
MRHKKLKLSAVLLLFFGLINLQAQDAVNAGGGDASGSGGSSSYSVGQTAYTSFTGTGGAVTEGVQQPYEIWVVTDIDETIGVDLFFTVKPNPTTDYLTLYTEDLNRLNLTYQLFDINGRILEDNKITRSETIIDMNQLVSATYFLKISDDDKVIKTFKIVKN